MIQIRRAKDRGHANHGWLDTYYTFSLCRLLRPRARSASRSLLVINEDRVEPATRVSHARPSPRHGDRHLRSRRRGLEHKDSMGNGSVLRPGEFQRMSAGTGVRHSEFNPSATEPVHLYQIWLLPDREGHKPSYEQLADRSGRDAGQAAACGFTQWRRRVVHYPPERADIPRHI